MSADSLIMVTELENSEGSKMAKKILAKIVRVVTIPPLLVLSLLTLVYFISDKAFGTFIDYLVAVACLALIPTLAYPLQKVIPAFKDKGRNGQRELAFIMSVLGYLIGFAYAIASGATVQFKFIITAYLVSVLLLLVFNKILHQKASGHACGVLGPLLFAIYFLGWQWAIPCAVIAVGVVWSSVALSRHTLKELCLGGACALTAFAAVGIGVIV